MSTNPQTAAILRYLTEAQSYGHNINRGESAQIATALIFHEILIELRKLNGMLALASAGGDTAPTNEGKASDDK